MPEAVACWISRTFEVSVNNLALHLWRRDWPHMPSVRESRAVHLLATVVFTENMMACIRGLMVTGACRMAMVDLEREIMHLVDEKSAEAQGLMVFHLSTLYRRAYTLFSNHDMTSTHSEWPNLRQVGHGLSTCWL